jgi:hypothetical protein
MRWTSMQQGNIHKELVLSENGIWKVPHVIQELRRNSLHRDDFLRIYIDDLAFGASQEEWIKKLLEEGNIGLGIEAISITKDQKNFSTLLEHYSKQWVEMCEYALDEANSYLKEQVGEIDENERTQFVEMIELAQRFSQEKSFGEAYSAADKAHQLIKMFIENKKRIFEEIFLQISMQIQKNGMQLMETSASKFLGGNEMLERAKKLHSAAHAALINRDFSSAQKMVLWLEDIFVGREVPVMEIDQMFVDNFVPAPKPSLDELPQLLENETSLLVFERDWVHEDDDFLIDNYDVMTNDQLKSKFISPIKEIEDRLRFLGLSVDRTKRIKLPIRNPYVAGRPIKSDKVFVGREDVFEFLNLFVTLWVMGPKMKIGTCVHLSGTEEPGKHPYFYNSKVTRGIS